MKKVIALLAAVGVVGSAFAAGDDILPSYDAGPMFRSQGPVVIGSPGCQDPRLVTMSIASLVDGGYIKPKDGVKIVWFGKSGFDESGYVVLNEKTGSHFHMTNDGISPISIKGKRAELDTNQLHQMAMYGEACKKSVDPIKNAECVLNFAATM